MKRLVLTALLLAPAAAFAKAPNAANLYTQQDTRTIAIQNWSGQTISSAQVQTTPDGHVWKLAHGHLANNEGANIAVPGHECIANVRVTLKNGHTLALNGLHSCNDSEIAVRKDRIWLPQNAVPAGKQQG